MNAGTPTAEIEITLERVRSLLTAQHPDLANLPLHRASSGWDNAMFRVGEHLAVRLPRRQLGAKLILTEQQWLPLIASRLTLATPNPIRIGKPSTDYRWSWSIVPWIEGETADQETLNKGEGIRLAEFMRSLHTPAPNNAPTNAFRGIPLAQRIDSVQKYINRVAAVTELITPTIQQTWRRAIAAPIATQSCWIHGDLHPHNILASKGEITGVIDWGDLTAGDVATDLAAVWMLLDDKGERQDALSAYQTDHTTQLRAKGWAISFATILLATGLVDNPAQAEIGRKTLRRIEEDS